MASILKVDTIQDQDGNNIINESANTITIGASGDTITIPSGATFASVGIDDNATSTAITIDSSQNVDIVGTTTSSNFISDGTGYGIKFPLNGTATLNTSSNSVIFTGSGASGDYLAGTLNLQSRGDLARDINLITGATASNTLTAHGNGDVSFYEDTGTTPKFYWDASTERLGIGTAAPVTSLHIAAGVPKIRIQDTDVANQVFDIRGASAAVHFDLDPNNDVSGSEILFDIDGSNKMIVRSSGNVGIGTNSPTENLHVFDGASSGSASVDIANFQQSSNDIGGAAYSLATAIKIGGTTRYAQIKALHNQWASSATALSFWTDNGTNTEKMRLDSSGRLGIGTSSPTVPLEVSGSALIGGQIIATGSTTTTASRRSIMTHDGSSMIFKASGDSTNRNIIFERSGDGSADEVMRISSSGNVGIGENNPAYNFVVDGGASTTVRVQNDNPHYGDFQAISTGIQIRTIGSYPLILNTNQTEKMRITHTGNVGIGTTNPSYLLDLYGNPGTSAGALLRLESSITDDNGIIHEQADGTKWFTGQETSNPNDYEFWNYNGSTWSAKLHIGTDGNVGIGTTSPTQKLDVNGTVKATAFQGDGSALTGVGGGGEASVEAWVNFNGTGSVSVRDSGNVSSVSDNGTGEFIVNFSSSFANTNYVFAGAGRDVNTNTSILGAVNYGRSDNIKETGRCEICSYNDATNALIDQPEINATFFYG